MKSFFQLREELQTTKLDEQMAGVAKKHQLYSADDDDEESYDHVDRAVAHAEKSKYKINHAGPGDHPAGAKKHSKPDVTFHYARGDDMPHAYTVHHDGAAAKDRKLHIKAIHMGHDQ